ncbi:hypothetical protein Mapa_006353 [Marchantia paleacea]|nr:hypothetical protein Mapa_006353 [Marchantia paleacea]
MHEQGGGGGSSGRERRAAVNGPASHSHRSKTRLTMPALRPSSSYRSLDPSSLGPSTRCSSTRGFSLLVQSVGSGRCFPTTTQILPKRQRDGILCDYVTNF